MSIPFKILANIGQVNFGANGSAYTAETAVTLSASSAWLVPAGYNFITGDGTSAKFEYTPDSTTTWRQVASTGYGGDCYSDGNNWRIYNSAATAITFWYFSIA